MTAISFRLLTLFLKQLCFILCMLMSFSAWSHGDDDHGATPPVMNQAVSPRAIATSEDFELVALLEQSKLMIYLDQLTTNTPVLNAKIEVEGMGLKQIAQEISSGVYAITLPNNIPSKLPFIFSIETEDTVDLLSAVLDSTPPVDTHHHEEVSNTLWYLVFAGFMFFAGALYWFMSRQKK